MSRICRVTGINLFRMNSVLLSGFHSIYESVDEYKNIKDTQQKGCRTRNSSIASEGISPGRQPFCPHFSYARCFYIFSADFAVLRRSSLAAGADRIIQWYLSVVLLYYRTLHSLSRPLRFQLASHYNTEKCRHLLPEPCFSG